MAPPLSASFDTISLLEDVFESCLLICREVRSGIVRYARYKIVVVFSRAVYKETINIFLPSGCVHSFVLLLLAEEQLSWFLVEKYSCKRLQKCSLS